MFKVNIAKWLEKEIKGTELALLRAEDELNEAQYRVKAIRSRLSRLKGKRDKAQRAAGPSSAFSTAPIPPVMPNVGESTDDFIARRRAAVSK